MYYEILLSLVLIAIPFLLKKYSKKKNHDLVVFEVKSQNVDAVLFNELWQLRKAYWPADTYKQYEQLVRSVKNKFVLFRDSCDGSLRGVYTKTFVNGTLKGKKYRALYLGHLFFYTYYRGNFRLGKNMLMDLIRHWWNTPSGVTSFVVFSAISYKSYVAAAHTYPNLYPTYLNCDDLKFADEKEVASQVMKKLYGDDWDGEKLHIPNTYFDAAPLRPEMLEDPHIKFFSERNPEYYKGITFPGSFRVTLFSLLHTFFRVITLRTPLGKLLGFKTHKSKGRKPRVPITRRDLSRTENLDMNLAKDENETEEKIEKLEKEMEKKQKEMAKRKKKLKMRFALLKKSAESNLPTPTGTPDDTHPPKKELSPEEPLEPEEERDVDPTLPVEVLSLPMSKIPRLEKREPFYGYSIHL